MTRRHPTIVIGALILAGIGLRVGITTASEPRLTAIAKPHAGAPVNVTPPRVAATAPAKPLAGDLATARSTLLRDGQRVLVTGVNAYEAATWWGVNWGCGAPVYDLGKMFDQVPPGGLVRVWAFQAQGWNNKVTPGHIDFFGLDRVVQAAASAHRGLILTLSDQAGVCDDGHWHDQAWYDGGYASHRDNDDGRGLGNLSYLEWVRAVVDRYRDSPGVAMWEPVNEPQAADCSGATGGNCYNAANLTCPVGAAASLVHFFDAIGTVIRGIDPHHLISEGVSAGGQCGLAGEDFDTVGASLGVDVLTYHDYGDETDALPSGLLDRLMQAHTIGKPLIVEEAGVSGGSACGSLTQRAHEVHDKAGAAMLAGASGWLPWWYDESGPASCGQDYGPGDPAFAALASTVQPP